MVQKLSQNFENILPWGYREEGGGDTKDQQVYYQGDMEKKEVVV